MGSSGLSVVALEIYPNCLSFASFINKQFEHDLHTSNLITWALFIFISYENMIEKSYESFEVQH